MNDDALSDLRPEPDDHDAAAGEAATAEGSLADVIESIEDEDGRRQRRRKNREAVIQSLLRLIQEGDLDPTVAKIAEGAGVSHRSVFRYFDDLDDLARTAIEQQFRESLPLGVIPGVGTGTFEHRTEAIVEARMRVFTATHSLWRVASLKSPLIPEITRGLRMVNDVLVDQIERHFASELETLSPADAALSTDVLASVLSFDAFDLQRRVLERDLGQIAAGWRLAIRALLAPA